MKPSIQSPAVATKDIRPDTAITSCDVCGRTLLRGERAEVYLDGGTRHSVCDLCKSRAVHVGWVREGTVPTYDGGQAAVSSRGGFFTRLRRRREKAPNPWLDVGEASEAEGPPAPRRRPRELRAQAERSTRGMGRRAQESAREPRHVHAVPVGAEQKIASAVQVFNNSEHRRTVAGVARSLGSPTVAIHPNGEHSSLVQIVASWELCWYRYEIDLSDEVPVVRVAAQGYELDELDPRDRRPNASYDAHGALGVA